jgi:predicted DCC family thiol-disulfide oxidoreductase YuxK
MNIILFDGVCNLCNNTVTFLIKYDKNNILKFAASLEKTHILTPL